MKRFSLILLSDNQKGFTLLEILIAITLLAFITIGVVDITDNAAETKERTTAVNENNLQIETAMSRFEWDFSQIYSPMYFSQPIGVNQNTMATGGTTGQDSLSQQTGGTQGGNQNVATSPLLQQYYEQLSLRFQQNEHFMGVSKEGMPIPRFYAPEKNLFEFFTSSNRRKVENQKQSHFAWVRYALANQEPLPEDQQKEGASKIPSGLKSFVRYFTAEDPYSPKRINPETIKSAVLLRNVETLEFQYWDLQKRKWETSLRTIQNGESLIRGVRILLSWYDNFGNKRTTVRVFRNHWPLAIPVDQPVGTTVGATSGQTSGATSGATSGSTTSSTQNGSTGNVNSGGFQ